MKNIEKANILRARANNLKNNNKDNSAIVRKIEKQIVRLEK